MALKVDKSSSAQHLQNISPLCLECIHPSQPRAAARAENADGIRRNVELYRFNIFN